MSNLVIVESPAKAKTIEGFLGSDFTVRSCYGHIRELPKKGDPIDVENDFSRSHWDPRLNPLIQYALATSENHA